MLSSATIRFIEQQLAFKLGGELHVEAVTPVAGGSINNTYCIKTTGERFFLKTNKKDAFPGLFSCETKGLKLLRENSGFAIPQVIFSGELNEQALLIMDFIDSGKQEVHFWEDFGAELARLHQHQAAQFGLDHDNYIGTLPQSNHYHNNWTDFFVLQRLEPLIKTARDEDHIGREISRRFDRLFAQLPHIFPEEPASLLHGDLWSGNFMCASSGKATVFDPAVYYGHREMDIAMTQLFGGFNTAFYSGYQAVYPLESGWQNRITVANLYPLLVHVNLFGGVYVQRLSNALRPFN
jgi:fructosamine-3-kinase